MVTHTSVALPPTEITPEGGVSPRPALYKANTNFTIVTLDSHYTG